MNDQKRSEISELGEFGLIDRLTKNIKLKNKGSLVGVGDDAAVIGNKEKLTLVSTDLLVEGIHFDMSYTPLKHLGYKAAVVNFSDIYAMNGTPEQITVSLAISNRFSLEAIEEIYEGIYLACEAYQVDLVGGDTTSSLSGLFISITVIGSAVEDEIIYRNTAKENDLICVSGDLGAAYMGLMVLEREKQVFKVNPDMQPDLEGMDYILERQLKPEARQDIGKMLKGIGVKPTAMIDISDGLAADLHHICSASGMGAEIRADDLPIHPDATLAAALGDGEDYELLFTLPAGQTRKMIDDPLTDVKITRIGTITTAKDVTIVVDGNRQKLEPSGWQHKT